MTISRVLAVLIGLSLVITLTINIGLRRLLQLPDGPAKTTPVVGEIHTVNLPPEPIRGGYTVTMPTYLVTDYCNPDPREEATGGRGPRIIPVHRVGKLYGLRIVGIGRSRVLTHLSLHSGDILTAIDGEPLGTLSEGMIFLRRLCQFQPVQYTLSRGPDAFTIDVRYDHKAERPPRKSTRRDRR